MRLYRAKLTYLYTKERYFPYYVFTSLGWEWDKDQNDDGYLKKIVIAASPEHAQAQAQADIDLGYAQGRIVPERYPRTSLSLEISRPLKTVSAFEERFEIRLPSGEKMRRKNRQRALTTAQAFEGSQVYLIRIMEPELIYGGVGDTTDD